MDLFSATKNGGALPAGDSCAIAVDGVTLHCDIASLGLNESVVVVVRDAVSCASLPQGGQIVLDNGTGQEGAAGDAIANADNHGDVNDSGKITVTCPPPPALTIVKSPNDGTFTGSGNADFTITVGNTSATAAVNVDIDDTLPGAGG